MQVKQLLVAQVQLILIVPYCQLVSLMLQRHQVNVIPHLIDVRVHRVNNDVHLIFDGKLLEETVVGGDELVDHCLRTFAVVMVETWNDDVEYLKVDDVQVSEWE